MQLQLADIKARIDRLDRLTRGLAKEAGQQRGAETVLLFRERRQITPDRGRGTARPSPQETRP
jgi:hypothetical protein